MDLTLFVGHLTVCSMMFVSVVIRIGIDRHLLLFRYREERTLSLAALERTAIAAGPASSRPSPRLRPSTSDHRRFRGIREFGFIPAAVLLGCQR
jgi:hypothetical protein